MPQKQKIHQSVKREVTQSVAVVIILVTIIGHINFHKLYNDVL